MISQLKPAIVLFAILTVITGILYPGTVTALAQLLFSHRANGSLISDENGNPVGSEMIGQPYSNPKYFWGRPSATAPYPYNGGASSGSNLGPNNPTLVDAIKARVLALQQADPANTAVVPVDLVTASGSGLDPHISPAAAAYQVNRVAKARRLDKKQIQDLIAAHTEGRQWLILGEPRVNVLQLNLALDALEQPKNR